MRVKALSLWEPWASLMRSGRKTIETRGWSTNHRGTLLICAAKRRNVSELSYLLEDRAFRDALGVDIGEPGDVVSQRELNQEAGAVDVRLLYGYAVALVDLVDVVTTVLGRTFAAERGEEAFGDYSAGRFAWMTTGLGQEVE